MTRGPARLVWTLAVAAVAGCQPGAENQPPRDRVDAVVLPYLTMAPLHIAAAEGYFDAHGLDVEFTRFARGQDMMAALARGEVDVAASMLTVNELNLIAAGEAVRAVAAFGVLERDACTFAAIIARRELAESGALADPLRVRQLRFDIDMLIPIGYWTDALLQSMGVSVDEVPIAYVPPPATIESMRQGSIDVTVESEPFVSMLLEGDANVLWGDVGDLLPGYVVSLLMYGPGFLEDRPEVGERFAAAILQATRQYAEGKTQRNLEIMQRATGLPADLVARACWPVIQADPRVDATVFDGYQRWNQERGLVSRGLSPEELVDQRFLDRAHEILGR